MSKYITRTVLILSMVSLFADMASEMLYPVLPFFLAKIGFGALWIGILEGLSEFISGLGKAYFGSLSDQLNRRNIFIRLGYGLSSIGKPLMGILATPVGVFSGRSLDRLGKGMRGAARDALLIDESAPENRGKVFGFHRAMDTLGAVLGPALALGLLAIWPGEYAWLFILSIFPGAISVGLTFLLKKEAYPSQSVALKNPLKGIFSFWKEAGGGYRKLLLVFLIFGLINSSDLFLIMRGFEAGLNEAALIGAYIFYNLVYAIASFPAGKLADKIGFKPVFLASLAVFAVVYGALGFGLNNWGLFAAFGFYGLFAAGQESIGKAWISLYVPAHARGTGMGLFQFLATLVKLIASPLTGVLWILTNGHTAFWVLSLGAIASLCLSILLLPGKDKPLKKA